MIWQNHLLLNLRKSLMEQVATLNEVAKEIMKFGTVHSHKEDLWLTNLSNLGTRKRSGSLVAPSRSERGGKTTRADLSAFKINVFHGVDRLYMPSRY